MKNRKCVRYRWGDLIAAHGSNCVYCHDFAAEVVDHVIPWSYSYDNSIENLVPACSFCNLLVGAKVYSGFEEKYNALVRLRNKKKRSVKRRTICAVCRVPYQYPFHRSSIILCPECFDDEYKMTNPDHKDVSRLKGWQNWLVLLEEANMPISIYREFRGMYVRGRSVDEKNDIFHTIWMDYQITLMSQSFG